MQHRHPVWMLVPFPDSEPTLSLENCLYQGHPSVVPTQTFLGPSQQAVVGYAAGIKHGCPLLAGAPARRKQQEPLV